MIIFKSLLTTFELSVVFEVAWSEAKIGLSLKPSQRKEILPS